MGQYSNYLAFLCNYISVLQPVESEELQAAKNPPPLTSRRMIEVFMKKEANRVTDVKDIETVILNSNATVYSKILNSNDPLYTKILDCHKAVYSKVPYPAQKRHVFGKQHVAPPTKKPRKQSNPKKYNQWFISNDAMAFSTSEGSAEASSAPVSSSSTCVSSNESPRKKARKQSNPKPYKQVSPVQRNQFVILE